MDTNTATTTEATYRVCRTCVSEIISTHTVNGEPCQVDGQSDLQLGEGEPVGLCTQFGCDDEAYSQIHVSFTSPGAPRPQTRQLRSALQRVETWTLRVLEADTPEQLATAERREDAAIDSAKAAGATVADIEAARLRASERWR